MNQVHGPLQTTFFALILCLGARGVAADVTLRGLTSAQETNVRNFLELARLPCDAPAWQQRRQTAQATTQISTGLEALGFYRSTTRITTATPRKKCWHTVIEVIPGPPTVYRETEVVLNGDARDDPAFQSLLAKQPLTPGAVVHHGRYRRFKRDLANLATARGYFDARFESSTVTVDEDLDGATAVVVFNSGARYQFGDVTIDSDLLTEQLFDVLQDIKPGDDYLASKITSTHRNFLDSGYFGFVNVSANPDNAEGLSVPVVIDVSPALRRVYTGGLGFATDVGPRFRLNYRNRRINRRGHALYSQLLVSPVQSELGVEYRIPLGDDRRDVLAFSGGFEEQDTDTSEFSSVELGARRTRALDSGWLNTAFIDLRREDFKVGDQDEVSTLLIPGMSWWRGSDTSSARPDNAYRLAFDVRGTSTAFGSDTSFVQVEARARYIRSLGPRTRLLSRLNVGATAKESRSELPPSLRFFAGGDSSVRGYGFETIGPLDDDGLVVGGGKLISASLELDWQLGQNWALALFADTGSAFDDEQPDFKTGVGIGIRRLTAVGPLRLDIAAPLDRDRLVRLHFSIGSDL